MEHQLNVINDFAEEIAFRNFLQNSEWALIDSFAIQLMVPLTGFLQRCVPVRWCSA